MFRKTEFASGMAIAAAIFLGTLGAASTYAYDQTEESAGGGIQTLQAPPTLQPFPLVVYDVTGSTIVGPHHLHLVVYWNGQAAIDRKDQLLASADGDRVLEALVTGDQLRNLDRALQNAGAGRVNPPINPNTADLPLTTVTYFLSARPNTRSHTFSYFDQNEAVARIDRIVQAFIDQVFPDIRT